MSDVLVPYFQIFISGKEIPKEYYSNIQGIIIRETSTGSNQCVLQLADPDMLFIEGKMIVESTPVKIVFGTNKINDNSASALSKSQSHSFAGYVSVIDADFPENGTPRVSIHCMDKTHLMNRKFKTRTWENCTISSVVEKVYREYGFKVVINDTKTKLESIQQSDETDIAFIVKLSGEVEDRVFLTYLEGETAYFVERLAPPPKHKVCYRLPPYNLYSFSPRINKESKKEAFNKTNINLTTLKIESSTVNPKVSNLGNIKVVNSTTRK